MCCHLQISKVHFAAPQLSKTRPPHPLLPSLQFHSLWTNELHECIITPQSWLLTLSIITLINFWPQLFSRSFTWTPNSWSHIYSITNSTLHHTNTTSKPQHLFPLYLYPLVETHLASVLQNKFLESTHLLTLVLLYPSQGPSSFIWYVPSCEERLLSRYDLPLPTTINPHAIPSLL